MFRSATPAAFILGAALALGALLTPAVAQEQANTVEKAKHGAWSVQCLSSNDQLCGIIQIGNSADNTPLVSLEFQKLREPITRDGVTATAQMVIAAPIGVFLPAGINMNIDGRDVGAAGYQVCNPSQCIVAQPVANELINQFKKGSNVTLTLVDRTRKPAKATLSLSGFTKAFNSL